MRVQSYKLRDMILTDFFENATPLVGSKLPATKDLAARYETSCPTVTKALRLLAEQGWVHARRGSGVYVAATPRRNGGHRLHPEKRIGCVVPGLRATLPHRVIEGVEAVARREGYVVEVAVGGWDSDTQRGTLSPMRDRGVQGVVLYPGVQSPSVPSYLATELLDFPIVVVDLYQPAMKRPHVIFDNVQAGKEMTRYLLGVGRREIAFMKFPDTMVHRALDDRLLGYRRALAEAKAQEYIVSYVHDEQWLRNYREVVERMLVSKPRPTAMIATDDRRAAAAIAWLRHKGVRVPEDIMVAGFDDLQREPWNERFPTTQPDFVRMGERATEILMERIKSRATDATGLILPCPLVLPATLGVAEGAGVDAFPRAATSDVAQALA